MSLRTRLRGLPEWGTASATLLGELVIAFQGELRKAAMTTVLAAIPTPLVLVLGLIAPVGVYQLVRTARSALRPRDKAVKASARPISTAFRDRTNPLVGRSAALADTIRLARDHSMVVVQGAAGLGTSTLATNAAWELAPETRSQRYADLRGPDWEHPETPLSVAQRVLRTLGLPPGQVKETEDAAREVLDTLQGSGKVLLLDNVTSWDQIAWLPARIPDAYVIVAGEVEGVPPNVRVVPLAPLVPEAGTQLLGSYISADRMGREREAVHRLASSFVGTPAAAVGIGRWLAENSKVSIAALEEDLNSAVAALPSERRVPHDQALRIVLDRSFRQVGHPARRLLASLARMPIAELSFDAAVAVLNRPARDVEQAIEELARHGLVEKVRVSRIRTADTIRSTISSGKEARAAWRRLVDHLGKQASRYARLLPREDAVLWFETEDRVLLQVLSQRQLPPVPRIGGALWHIADGLDAWFAREQRHDDRLAAARALAWIGMELRDREARAVGELRQFAILLAMGDPKQARRHFNNAAQLRGGVEAWPPELHLAHAAILMATGDDFTAVESALVHYGQSLPGGYLPGQALRLLNVGALLLRQGQLLDDDPARVYEEARSVLIAALDKAQQASDPGVEAHVEELLGLVHWYLGKSYAAEGHWQNADRLYGAAGDTLGHARCQVQWAGAMLQEPGPRVTEAADLLAAATRWLPPAGLTTALAHLHLATVEPARAASHRTAGLAALAPWDAISEPRQITDLRARLTALP